MQENIKISIVSPVYMAEGILSELVDSILLNIKSITNNFEIILVEDGSSDGSWDKIMELKQIHPEIVGLKLSRNFGQHAAIYAGLEQVLGEWIIVIDCDLQDDPVHFKALYQRAIKGWEIVLARRVNRIDSFFKRLFSKIFYRILGYLTDSDQDSSVANFGIYHKNVILSLKEMKDYIKYFPTSVNWVGYKKTTLDVNHKKRLSGKSTYSYKKLIRLGLNVVLSFSDKPLRLVVKVGILVSFVSMLIAFYYLLKYFSGEILVSGFTSLIVSIWFLSGIIITTIGMAGLYIGRIFDQAKDRPVYIIQKKI
jgi:dolichol-phosphate mannosyltransferase